MNCDKHRDKKKEYFWKYCEKSVCEECIVESHACTECQSRICTINHEFEETTQKLQGDLDRIEMNKVVQKCLEFMEKQKSEFENLEREIEALKLHCLEVLKRRFDEVKSGFQNKAKMKKDGYETNKEKLQKMKNIHKNLCDFMDGSLSLQNKAGFLQLAPKVVSQIGCLQNEIKKIKEKVIDETEKVYYLMWIEEILNGLQLAAGKKASVDFALEVAEECQGYPLIIRNLSQYRRPNRAKEVQSENFVKSYRAIYNRVMFPRYEYHLELINTIVVRAHQIDDNNITYDLSKLPESNILVYGRETDVDRNLLQPLILEDENENIWRNFILVVFIDTIDDEEGTFVSIERQMINCIWCIIISSNNDAAEIRERLTTKGLVSKSSIIPPDSDLVWNHLTSALELPLIEILQDEKNWSPCVLEDVQTVLKRIEKCSDFPELGKHKHKCYDIPQNIKNILERFEEEIVRYGFYFEKFRVVVSDEKFSEVNEALSTITPANFCEIIVISQETLKQQERVELFNGNLQAQGKKLYQLPKSPQQGGDFSNVKDYYGTLGSLALLNNEKTVALSCRHVCLKEDSYVYIETEKNERIPLGKCRYISKDDPKIQSDLAIVEIDGNMEEYFSVKKLLNHTREPTNAEVFCLEEKLDIRGEIVHKLGAVSEWTQGVIVCSELIKNIQGIIAVRGMNGEEFGKPGDSGSIVFRESPNARVRKLEVVAVLSAGKIHEIEPEDQASGGEKEKNVLPKLVICTVFKDAFEQIKKNYDSVESIAFF